MCGIAGHFGPTSPAPKCVQKTLALMARRGPDDSGKCEIAVGKNKLTFLHTRLAIIDLDHRATQPYIQDGLSLIFNGEIYNYIELKNELKSLGCDFRTNSDTEVLLQAYQHWGVDCFNKLEGMFALAIFDKAKQTLTLARDAFGEKPLYTMFDGEAFYFGSQIKFLYALGLCQQNINMERLARFLGSGYRNIFTKNDTAFENIKSFPAGHYAQIQIPKTPVPQEYWRLDYKPTKMNMEDAKAGVREHFFNALKLRLRADVPIALTLSGGVDSNVLASVAIKEFGRDMHAFSMVEPEKDFSEEKYIKKAVAKLGCKLHLKRVTHDDFLERMEYMTRYFDAPLSSVGMYLDGYLAQSVKDAGYKVAINGIGSDELFTGYYDHYLYWLASQRDRPDFQNLVEDWQESHGKWVTNPFFKDPEIFIKTPNARDYLFRHAPNINEIMKSSVETSKIEQSYTTDLLRNRMLNEIRHEAVPVYMHDGDLNWMYQSIENRTPYLDKRLASFLFSVPNEHMIHKGYTKYLLRNVGEDITEPSVLNLKRKTGFNAPINSLLDLTSDIARDLLLMDSPVFDILDRPAVEKLIKLGANLQGYDNFIFALCATQIFLHTQKSP